MTEEDDFMKWPTAYDEEADYNRQVVYTSVMFCILLLVCALLVLYS
jgi:hypothetical protein